MLVCMRIADLGDRIARPNENLGIFALASPSTFKLQASPTIVPQHRLHCQYCDYRYPFDDPSPTTMLDVLDIQDDIIREVFKHASTDDPPRCTDEDDNPEWRDQKFHLGWIFMTHVCRRWRAIGLDMGTLWASAAIRVDKQKNNVDIFEKA
ncbi:hypothetical protein PENSPDRAFT_693961 [Peniophora sp. CONT]|nr:hypothetical protein PENSPDRAFT_693961 [Peniophora sp. CONT]